MRSSGAVSIVEQFHAEKSPGCRCGSWKFPDLALTTAPSGGSNDGPGVATSPERGDHRQLEGIFGTESTATSAMPLSTAAVDDGGGFGWLTAPRGVFERYWGGVVLVPERTCSLGDWTGPSAAPRAPAPGARQRSQAHIAATRPACSSLRQARGRGIARAIIAGRRGAAARKAGSVSNLDIRRTGRRDPSIQAWAAIVEHPFPLRHRRRQNDCRSCATKLLSDFHAVLFPPPI